eukprot:584218-Amphidinium_carterae.1
MQDWQQRNREPRQLNVMLRAENRAQQLADSSAGRGTERLVDSRVLGALGRPREFKGAREDWQAHLAASLQVSGSALAKVRNVQQNNGLEAWKHCYS